MKNLFILALMTIASINSVNGCHCHDDYEIHEEAIQNGNVQSNE